MKRRRWRLWRPILRPRAGRKLPSDLRPENVGRLAAALPEGLRDPGFLILLRRIDQSPVLDGNRVRVFFRGPETFEAMRAAIDAAQNEVLIESYIFKDDATGRSLLETLSRAVARGVTVRVLADAFGSIATRRAFWKEMRAAGIEVRLFNPLFPHLLLQPFRDHRKILVIDAVTAFTGGMNIGEALVLDSRPFRGTGEIASSLAAMVAAARRRIWITNAYFAPRRRAVDLLGEAAARGVDVRLLLPGVSDVPLVRHAGHGYYAPLLARGVRIFEYQGAVLHAKTVVADDFLSIAGSSNLDFRSFHFNAECNVVLFGSDTARCFTAAFEKDLEKSVEITRAQWARRSFPHRVGDALARRLGPIL